MLIQVNEATQNVINNCKYNNLDISGICRSGDNNSFAIFFVKDKKYADIEVYDVGSILAVTSSRSDDVKVWQVENLQESIDKIKKFLNN